MESIKISAENFLVYRKEYTKDFIQETIATQKLQGLRVLCNTKADELKDLNFLEDYTFLEGLAISSILDYDLGFLKGHHKLKHLSITIEGQSEIDLTSFKKLEVLTIKWRRKIIGIKQYSNLKELCLVEFGESSLARISTLSQLEELIIKTAKIKSLEGIENLTHLKKIEIGNARNLLSLSAAANLDNVIRFELEGCRKN